MKSIRFFLFVFPVTVFATTLVEQYLPESPAANSNKKIETQVISAIDASSQTSTLLVTSTQAANTTKQENNAVRSLLAAKN